nr:MAG TPA: hypothetical protein [Bacteriophage sp.]
MFTHIFLKKWNFYSKIIILELSHIYDYGVGLWLF